MRISILLGAAALLCMPSLGATQAMQTPPAPPPNDMGPQQMPQGAPPADPNANVPTGAVPADTGMVPADPNAARDAGAPVGSPQNPAVVGGNVTPPPEPRADYPLCSRAVQDSCVNPGEAAGKGKARRRR